MTIRKIDEIVKLSKHKLEEHFDIEPGTTELVIKQRKTELEQYDQYDSKDRELEEDYQLIMDSALDITDVLKEQINGNVEGKYLARLVEVAGQHLNIALSAAEKKARMKDNKDKFILRKNTLPGSKTVNHNNTIIMTQSEALALLLQGDAAEPPIDGEYEEVDVPNDNKE